MCVFQTNEVVGFAEHACLVKVEQHRAPGVASAMELGMILELVAMYS